MNSQKAGKPSRLFTPLRVVALVLLGLGAVVVTFLTNVRFAARPRQHECEMNLKWWFTVQRTRPRGGALEVDTVDFRIERGNRYAYFAGPGPIEDRSVSEPRHGPDAVGYGVDLSKHKNLKPITLETLPPQVASLAGFRGSQCPQGADCSITLLCAGNIDRDDTLDVWSISTVERTGPDGERYMPGEPVHHVNDVTN